MTNLNNFAGQIEKWRIMFSYYCFQFQYSLSWLLIVDYLFEEILGSAFSFSDLMVKL